LRAGPVPAPGAVAAGVVAAGVVAAGVVAAGVVAGGVADVVAGGVADVVAGGAAEVVAGGVAGDVAGAVAGVVAGGVEGAVRDVGAFVLAAADVTGAADDNGVEDAAVDPPEDPAGLLRAAPPEGTDAGDPEAGVPVMDVCSASCAASASMASPGSAATSSPPPVDP
jgi:hypothetical protein